MFRALIRIAALFPLLLCACTQSSQCTISTLGDLPVLNDRGSPVVKVTINGHPAALIIDTGAQVSAIWPGQVEKLGLDTRFKTVRLSGAGGDTAGGVATADTVGIGSGTAHDVVFVTVGTLSDGRTIDGLPVVGLFGADFLSGFNVVFDLPNHRVSLFTAEGCKDDTPEWQGEFYKVDVSYPHNDSSKTLVHLKLDDRPVDAILDSGASRTLISTDDAHTAGVSTAALLQDRKTSGYGIEDVRAVRYRHRFDSLQIGPFRINHPVLDVGDTEVSLLGAEFLRTHRVMIPRRASWIYIQPERSLTKILLQPAAPKQAPATPKGP